MLKIGKLCLGRLFVGYGMVFIEFRDVWCGRGSVGSVGVERWRGRGKCGGNRREDVVGKIKFWIIGEGELSVS